MTLANTAAIVLGVSAVGGLVEGAVNANTSKDLAGQAESISSAQFGEQQTYNTMLQQLIQNPSAFLNSPTFTSQLNTGLAATTRALAAGGFSGSGNMAEALEQFGQSDAQSSLTSQEGLLAQLTGLGGNAASQSLGTAVGAQQSSAEQISSLFNTLMLYGTLGSKFTGAGAGTPATSAAAAGALSD